VQRSPHTWWNKQEEMGLIEGGRSCW